MSDIEATYECNMVAATTRNDVQEALNKTKIPQYMPTFYDVEHAEIIKQAIAYLATERGQLAINRLAQKDPALHRALTMTHHSIPWHNLGLPGWADERDPPGHLHPNCRWDMLPT